ncbi:MAG: tRNA pseudouridine(55) synthase TruB [Gammaproteobacteria bacterium RBG_16_57_12]|nr:MAG: tRNA pseudouridine(55) synthase TruB [Gammaproteobacteria bacterium RBG_16_57_12]
MARRHKGRNVHGIVLLDKPRGITSNAALQRVKRLFQAAKAGHTGSLDPMATGMLPICLGEATKISNFLLDADKRYRAVCTLGVTTTTADTEGTVLHTRPVPVLTPEQLQQIRERFSGEIVQIPPMHSAIKHQGQPLYKLAHQGLEVARQPRRVTIYHLEITGCQGDQLELEIHCSKGTYIRTLAEDIGEFLGCGAHLSALERTGVGQFDAADLHTPEQLQELAEQGLEALDQALLPMESALWDWPDVRLTEDMAFYLRRGQAVFVPRSPSHGWVRIFTAGNRFLGMGEVQDDGKIAPRRLVNVG